MPPLMMLPITSEVASAPMLDVAKFQLGMSFFAWVNERKNTDSPNAKRAAAWAMPISVSERSGEREYKNHVSAMSNACMVICIIHLREFRLTSSHHRCKVSDKRVPVER